jgi:hypothetical protein
MPYAGEPARSRKASCAVFFNPDAVADDPFPGSDETDGVEQPATATTQRQNRRELRMTLLLGR